MDSVDLRALSSDLGVMEKEDLKGGLSPLFFLLLHRVYYPLTPTPTFNTYLTFGREALVGPSPVGWGHWS